VFIALTQDNLFEIGTDTKFCTPSPNRKLSLFHFPLSLSLFLSLPFPFSICVYMGECIAVIVVSAYSDSALSTRSLCLCFHCMFLLLFALSLSFLCPLSLLSFFLSPIYLSSFSASTKSMFSLFSPLSSLLTDCICISHKLSLFYFPLSFSLFVSVCVSR